MSQATWITPEEEAEIAYQKAFAAKFSTPWDEDWERYIRWTFNPAYAGETFEEWSSANTEKQKR